MKILDINNYRDRRNVTLVLYVIVTRSRRFNIIDILYRYTLRAR